MKLNNLKDLYIEQLRDLYSAERQIVSALPEMAENASHKELKTAIQSHLDVTRKQQQRLEQIFKDLGENPAGETCEAMQGLIEEARTLLEMDADPDVLDAGLITSIQRIEHYEIAGYGTVATYADVLNRKEDLKLLRQTLSEEEEADKKLTRIAKEVVNPEAARA